MKSILLLLLIVISFSSCSDYQKVLKDDEIAPKYELAKSMYDKGLEKGKSKYFTKAIRLFDQICLSIKANLQVKQ